jgi:hypothetical protein
MSLGKEVSQQLHLPIRDFKSCCKYQIYNFTLLHYTTNTLPNQPTMPLTSTRRTAPRTTRATRTTARPSLKTRLLGGGRKTRATRVPATTTTTTTTKTSRPRYCRTCAPPQAPCHHGRQGVWCSDEVEGKLDPQAWTQGMLNEYYPVWEFELTGMIRLLEHAACTALMDEMPVVFTRCAGETCLISCVRV